MADGVWESFTTEIHRRVKKKKIKIIIIKKEKKYNTGKTLITT